MGKGIELIRLGRMEHGILTAITVVASYYVAGGRSGYVALFLFLSSFFAEVFLFVTNDMHNVNEDRINRPTAPLVTGTVTLKEAQVLASASLALSLIQLIPVIMGLANPLSLAVLASALVLGYSYNLLLKRRMIINNVLVSLVTSLTYLYGLATLNTITHQSLRFIGLLFLTTMVATLGREILKGSMDYSGDLRVGVSTIATRYGQEVANRVGSIILLTAVALSIPLIFTSLATLGWVGPVFSSFVLATDALMVMLSIRAFNGDLRLFRELSLLAMGLTLVGLMVSAILLFISS